MKREGIPQRGDEIRGRRSRSRLQEDGIVHSREAGSGRDASAPLHVGVDETDACADGGLPLRPRFVLVARLALRMIVIFDVLGTGPRLKPDPETEAPQLLLHPRTQDDVVEGEVVCDRPLAGIRELPGRFDAARSFLPGVAPGGLVGDVDAEGRGIAVAADAESQPVGPGVSGTARDAPDFVARELGLRIRTVAEMPELG